MLPPQIAGFLLVCTLWLVPTAACGQEVTATPHHTFHLPDTPVTLAFSGDGSLLLGADEEGRVVGWNIEQKTRITQSQLPEEPLFIGILAGDTSFVSVDRTGRVSIGAIDGGASSVRFRAETQPLQGALGAGRRYLALATEEERIALFDLQASMFVGRIDARDQWDDPLFVGFDRRGEQLVAITKRGEVASWNPKTQRLIRKLALGGGTLHGSRSVIHAATANSAANVFVVGLEEVALPQGGLQGRARPGDLERRNLIIAYDWESGIEIKRITYPEGQVKDLALGPGSDHVAVANEKQSDIALLDLRRGELGSTVAAPSTPKVLAVSDDDRWLAAGTEDDQVAVWRLKRQNQPTADELEASLPTLSGRIRVLSEKEPLLRSDTTVQLAVLPFGGNGKTVNMAGIISGMLTTKLANVDSLTLLERERIDEVLDELNLQASDLTASNGARIGRLLNADYLILGSVNALGATYLFSARLLRVETAEIESGRQVICEECRVEDIFEAMQLLGTTLVQ